MTCRVRFQTSGKEQTALVAEGTSLLAAALERGLPVARSCAGHSLCGRCGMRVFEGADALSPEQPSESEAKQRNRIDAGLRLSCCAEVRGDVTVTASYW